MTIDVAMREDVCLMGHLMRRAGFGAPASELERLAQRGYEAVVEDLVNPERFPEPDMKLFDRFHPERAQGQGGTQAAPWIFRMLNTQRPSPGEDVLAVASGLRDGLLEGQQPADGAIPGRDAVRQRDAETTRRSCR